jgi:prolyl oligopeptidase
VEEPDLSYPPARVEEIHYTVAGVGFSDPYGWLDEESGETAEWQRAENALTDEFVREWPHFARLRELVGHYVADGNGSPNWMVDQPARFAGGFWFQLDRPGPEYPEHAVVTVSEQLSGSGRVLYDPNADGDHHVSWFAPSPDGRTVAAGVCAGGSELGEIRLFDVATGSRLPDRIPQSRSGRW